MKRRYIFLFFILALCFSGCLNEESLTGENVQDDAKKAKIEMYTILDNYIKDTVVKVNEGSSLRLYNPTVLYMIPVGNESEKSCVVNEDGKSPYDANWSYAYVAVTYDSYGYEYFIVAEDEKNNGVSFISQSDLKNEKSSVIYNEGSHLDIKDILKSNYNNPSNSIRGLNNTEISAFSDALSKNRSISQIIYIAGGSKCRHQN